MIYFSFKEILLASVSHFSLGCIFGVLYQSVTVLLIFLRSIFTLPKYSLLKYKKQNFKGFNLEQKRSNGLIFQFTDFFFVVIFGIFLLLFNYVFLDGSIRLFPLIFVTVGYFISAKTFAALFKNIINKLLNVVLDLLLKLNFITLFPLFYLISIIKRLFSPIILKLTKKYKIKRLLYKIKKKNKEIAYFFTK